MKSKSMNMLILALLMVSMAGIGLMLKVNAAQREFEKSIQIDSEQITAGGSYEENLSFELLCFYPGVEKGYTLAITAPEASEYKLSLDFNETQEGDLEKYLDVSIECGSVKVTRSLEALFAEGEKTQFICDLKKGEKVKIYINYSMPLETGNESQGAEAYFDIIFTAELN